MKGKGWTLSKIWSSKFEILVENIFWQDHNFWSQFKKHPYVMLHHSSTSFKPGCQSSQILRPGRCEAHQTRGSTPEVGKILKPIVKREWVAPKHVIWCGSGEPNRPPIRNLLNFLQHLRPCHTCEGWQDHLAGFLLSLRLQLNLQTAQDPVPCEDKISARRTLYIKVITIIVICITITIIITIVKLW